MRSAILIACLLFLLIAGLTYDVAAEEEKVVGWRGDGTGCFHDCSPPTSWSKREQVAWQAKMPGPSYSSPIVVGHHVFTLAEPGELLCVQASDGKICWQRSHGYDEIFSPETAKEIASQLASAQKVQERKAFGSGGRKD